MERRVKFSNETIPTVPSSSSSYGFVSSSFPHYKSPMPNDQRAKLLAMHKAGRANAGIYVAVVLAVYVFLLTMLLCRYAKRQRPTDSSGTLPLYTQPPPTVPPETDNRMSLSRLKFILCEGISNSIFAPLCCPHGDDTPGDDSIHEDEPVSDFPLHPLSTTTHCLSPHREGAGNTLLCPNVVSRTNRDTDSGNEPKLTSV